MMQLEKELAQARQPSNVDRQTKEPHGTSVGEAASHHGSKMLSTSISNGFDDLKPSSLKNPSE